MAGKNILADTDYTKGHDNRFQNAVLIGKVSKIECSDKGANVRVLMPDRVDHKNQPLITKPIPVWQHSAGGKKSFMMPRVGQNAILVKLPNGTSDYMVLGTFYTSKDPPPVTDPMLDYTIYDDGSVKQFDANAGTETWRLKGDVNMDNEGAILIKLAKGFTVQIQGDVLIDAPNIHLKGAMVFEGDIDHRGSMTTSLTHTDSLGHHTNAARQEELEARVRALEARVAELEQLNAAREAR
jgi:phage baseplate assembly protein V